MKLSKFTSIIAAIVFTAAQVFAQDFNMLLGNPSDATADSSNPNNFLVVKDICTLSYNNANGTPNWVSWSLKATDIGSAPRVAFHPDETLPAGFNRITPRDYTGSGFDRGHMCNHSDRSATSETSFATFVMSNMVPQSSANNEKGWAQLEAYCRELVTHHQKHLYIVSGPAGTGGTGKKGKMDSIGKDHFIRVPAETWKVIMVLDGSQPSFNDAQKVDAHTRLIAIIMPNDETIGEDWTPFRVSVRDVEDETGFTFFSKVPKSILDPLKEQVDAEDVSTIPIHH